MEPLQTITELSLDLLREKVASIFGEGRLSHTLEVEKAAIRIGEIYLPGKINYLRAAALLHDITKEKKLDEQLQLCAEFGIMVEDTEKFMPNIFHARTAAAMIPRDFPEYATEVIVSAVKKHTTGAAEMSLFDKIIYLADGIEDTREYENCVRLRHLFYSGLEACCGRRDLLAHLDRIILTALNMTLTDLIAAGEAAAQDTFLARNSIIFSLMMRA